MTASYVDRLLAAADGGPQLAPITYTGASSPVDFDESGDLTSMFFRTFVLEGGKVVPKDSVQP